jgi:hypothetical protein
LNSTKEQGATEGTPGLAHRTVRCATGHVRCTRGTQTQTRHLREFSEATRLKFTGLSGVHRTVSGAPREVALRNSPASGFHSSRSAIIHRTVRCAPDCPVCTGLSGASAEQRLLQAPTATCSAFIARQRAQRSGTPMLAHRTLYSTCPVRHRTSRRAQKSELQRSISNGTGDVAGAPDCPVCTGLSGAPSNRQPSQRSSLVVGAINTPTTPPFIASKFSTSQLLQEL